MQFREGWWTVEQLAPSPVKCQLNIILNQNQETFIFQFIHNVFFHRPGSDHG